eukprot:7210857-Alexandrium_andersonii.AAC.1
MHFTTFAKLDGKSQENHTMSNTPPRDVGWPIHNLANRIHGVARRIGPEEQSHALRCSARLGVSPSPIAGHSTCRLPMASAACELSSPMLPLVVCRRSPDA